MNLLDKYHNAVNEADFRSRVMMGTFDAAVHFVSAVALSDQTKQEQRVRLIASILRDPTYGLDIFAKLIVSQTTVNTPDDLTDTLIDNTCVTYFDPVAQQLIPVSLP